MVRRISSSRPMIGSILPSRAASVRSRVYFFSASYCCSALALSAVRPLRRSLIAAFSACAVTPAAFSASFAPDFVTASAVSSRSTVTKLSPAWLASFSASASTFAVWVSTDHVAALDARQLGERPLHRRPGRRRVAAGARDQVRGQPLVVVEQRLQQVLRQEPLVVLPERDRLPGLNEPPRPFRELLEIHVSLPQATRGRLELTTPSVLFGRPHPRRGQSSRIWAPPPAAQAPGARENRFPPRRLAAA